MYASPRSCGGCRASPSVSGSRCHRSCCCPFSASRGSACCCRYCPGGGLLRPMNPVGELSWGLLPSQHHLPPYHGHRTSLKSDLLIWPLNLGPTTPCLELPNYLREPPGAGRKYLARDMVLELTLPLAGTLDKCLPLSEPWGMCGWSLRFPQLYFSTDITPKILFFEV